MLLKREEGAAAVEFALVLPILLVLVFGIIEFGLILYYQGVVSSASREAARRGIVISRPTNLKEWVEGTYCPSLIPGCVASPEYGTGQAGDPLTVKVEYDYPLIVIDKLLSLLKKGDGSLGDEGKFKLTGITTMLYE